MDLSSLGLTPDQLNALIAGAGAGLVFKLVDLLLALAAKLAKKTKTQTDDELIAAIAKAVHLKIKK